MSASQSDGNGKERRWDAARNGGVGIRKGGKGAPKPNLSNVVSIYRATPLVEVYAWRDAEWSRRGTRDQKVTASSPVGKLVILAGFQYCR